MWPLTDLSALPASLAPAACGDAGFERTGIDMCTQDTTMANATGADFDGDGVRDLVVPEGVDPYTARVRLAVSDDSAWVNRSRNRVAMLLSRR